MSLTVKSFTETLNALQTQNTASSKHIKELQEKLIEATGKAAVSALLETELKRARAEVERVRAELDHARLPWYKRIVGKALEANKDAIAAQEAKE